VKTKALSPTSRLAGLVPYLVLAIAAALLVASHAPIGAALSMDSLFYLSAAENILQGNGIVNETYALTGPTYEAMTVWPPLYPIVVAGITPLAGMTDTSTVSGIALFNFLALLLTLILVLRISIRTTSITAGVFVAIALALSPSIQIAHTYAWSEVVFIPLCLAAYLFLQSYLSEDNRKPALSLAFAVVLLGLASYTRYVGVVFFATTGLILLACGRGQIIDRFRTAAVASAAYLAILAPMFVRNYLVSGSLSGGDRGVPAWSLLADLKTLSWYLYLEFLNLPILWALVIVLVSIGSVAWLLFRAGDAKEQGHASNELSSIALPLLFAGCYLAFLLVSRSIQTIDLDSRMLSVAIPFVLIGLVNAYQWLSTRTGRLLAMLPFLLPLFAFSANAVYTHSNIVAGWRDFGEPGPVLGLSYRSITGRQTLSLRKINEHVSPEPGDLVLTDIRRPIIVDYIFPESDVRRLPGEPSVENLLLLEGTLSRSGIAILGSNTWSRALMTDLEGRAEYFSIANQSGVTEYVVMILPVKTQ